jgi:iron-sulfur cluster assembly protein/iron-sulfur cluster insertion protein
MLGILYLFIGVLPTFFEGQSRFAYVDRPLQVGFMISMVTLTDSAIVQIRKLEAGKAKTGQLLRIFVEAGGCSGFEYGMSFDYKKEGDRILENNGVSFLMDASSFEYLDGSVIHFDDGLNGKGFDIQNPNASSTCGCGRSFN